MVPVDNALVLRLGRFAPLSPVETALLRNLPQTARYHPVNTQLCLRGQVSPPQILLAGWACDHRTLSDGRRQIIRFLLPGDVIGSLDHAAWPQGSTVATLTPAVVADAGPLLSGYGDSGASMPGLVTALDVMNRVDATDLRNHIVRLGRQTAYERLVHLMLEFHHRLQAISMVDGTSFALPLTQEILADALGLSVVHVNRTLQQVRRDGLLDLRGGRVTLHQITRMQTLVDWAATD